MLHHERTQKGSQDARRHEKQSAAHPTTPSHKAQGKSASWSDKHASRDKRK